MKRSQAAAGILSVMFAVVVSAGLSECGKSDAEVPALSTVIVPSGISPQKFADAVHAVMMSDRTVYPKQVVTRLKKREPRSVPANTGKRKNIRFLCRLRCFAWDRNS